MSRGISPNFMHELKNGRLRPILQLVQQDQTLSLFIRQNRINIYYRGGSLLEISQDRNDDYRFVFNDEYLNHLPILPRGLCMPRTNNLRPAGGSLEDEVDQWMAEIPGIKLLMDRWFSKHQWREREFEQMMDRTNNSIADTDYFICDMEYSNTGYKQLRADLIALK